MAFKKNTVYYKGPLKSPSILYIDVYKNILGSNK